MKEGRLRKEDINALSKRLPAPITLFVVPMIVLMLYTLSNTSISICISYGIKFVNITSN